MDTTKSLSNPSYMPRLPKTGLIHNKTKEISVENQIWGNQNLGTVEDKDITDDDLILMTIDNRESFLERKRIRLIEEAIASAKAAEIKYLKEKIEREDRESFLLLKYSNTLFSIKFNYYDFIQSRESLKVLFQIDLHNKIFSHLESIRLRNEEYAAITDFTGSKLQSELHPKKDLLESQIKIKLGKLTNFISHHTNRKIMYMWNSIEQRFNKSNQTKSVVVSDEKTGLKRPVKFPAITLSTLTVLLCSSKVRVSHSELPRIYDKFDTKVHKDEITHSRKIAAVRCSLGPNNGAGLIEAPELIEQLVQLNNLVEERLVSLNELMNAVFPSDPVQRKEEMEELEKERKRNLLSSLHEVEERENVKLEAETRKNKNINDFAKLLKELQFVKGPYTASKHRQLKGVVAYADTTSRSLHAAKNITVPDEMLFLLGIESFPKLVRDSLKARKEKLLAAKLAAENKAKGIKPKGKKDSDQSEAAIAARKKERNEKLISDLTGASVNANQRFDYGGEFRILLQGNGAGSVLDNIKDCVAHGKGLNGCSAMDVVLMLQAYASIRIQGTVRSFQKRWKYNIARLKWRIKYALYKKIFFKEWGNLARRNIDTRLFCWRKILVWNRYTKLAKIRRELFCICYWPYYVWRRYICARRTASEKARFLTGRVMPTLLTLQVFRGWKKYSAKETRMNLYADRYNRYRDLKKMSLHFVWLERWTVRRRELRKSWLTKGMLMNKKEHFKRTNTPFQIWRCYVYYKTQIRKRAHFYAPILQRFAMKEKPFPAPNRTTRRLDIKKEMSDLVKKMKAEKAAYEEEEFNNQLMQNIEDDATMDDSIVTDMFESSEDKLVRKEKKKEKKRKKKKRPKLKPKNFEKPILELQAKQLIAATKVLTFGWHMRWEIDPPDYDIDSDGEDLEDLPNSWFEPYKSSIQPFIMPDNLPFLEYSTYRDEWLMSKLDNMAKISQYSENWAMIETSKRFHRFAKRTLQNLRIYAIVSKNYRHAMRVYRKRLLLRYFGCLVTWMVRDPKLNGGITPAEDLKNTVRAMRMHKIVRRRETVAEMKAAMDTRHSDDEDEVAERRIAARKKRIEIEEYNREHDIVSEVKSPVVVESIHITSVDTNSTMSLSTSSSPTHAVSSSNIHRANNNDTSSNFDIDSVEDNNIDTEPNKVIGFYQPPDLLAWDRKDREEEQDIVEKMLNLGIKMRADAEDCAKTSDNSTAELYHSIKKSNEMTQEIMCLESDITSAAIVNQSKYTMKFKIHAAENLVNRLVKIHREVVSLLMRQETRKYFKSLQMPMLLARSKSMRNRKKIVNWLRICRRLSSMDRQIDVYRVKRSMWVIFNRWLKLVEIESLNASPGLVKMVARRAHNCYAFSGILKSKGFTKSVYHNNRRLEQESSTFEAVFYRWVMFVQEEKMFAKLESLVEKKRIFKLKYNIFWAIKSFMTMEELKKIQETDISFPLTRINCDLDHITKRFIAYRRRDLSRSIQNYNSRFNHFQMQDGRSTMSFKKFLKKWRSEIQLRMVEEQKILAESFHSRGIQEFKDVISPYNNDKFPLMMSRMEGKKFQDPSPDDDDNPQNIHTLPGGFFLHKIRLNFQEHNGIVGWQLVWSADMCPDIESAKRGRWNGAAMNQLDITIPKDEFIVGVDYLYEGSIIMGLRLNLHFSGWTKMYGEKNSLSTLTLHLDIDMANKETFEDMYVSPGIAEDENPGVLRAYVIGFTGIDVKDRSTCLGLIVRKVIKQNLFSYHWVQDALDARVFDNTELAIGGANEVEMEEVPENIPIDGGVEVTNDEELTVGTANLNLPSIGGVTLTKLEEKEDVKEDDHLPQVQKDEHSLSRSEEQFFDVLRMRTLEIQLAEKRTEAFARRMWTSKVIRADPLLYKLTTVRIVSGLSRWYFESICKKLVQRSPTELKGQKLLSKSYDVQLKCETINRKYHTAFYNLKILEATPQVWHGKSMLAPKERILKNEFREVIKGLKDTIRNSKESVINLKAESLALHTKGTSLLSRMPLSESICINFRLKVAAARHKEQLLERMDMETIKIALIGGGVGKDNTLSSGLMSVITKSLQDRPPTQVEQLTLEKIVLLEMDKMRKAEISLLKEKEDISSLSLLSNHRIEKQLPNISYRKNKSIDSAHSAITGKVVYPDNIPFSQSIKHGDLPKRKFKHSSKLILANSLDGFPLTNKKTIDESKSQGLVGLRSSSAKDGIDRHLRKSYSDKLDFSGGDNGSVSTLEFRDQMNQSLVRLASFGQDEVLDNLVTDHIKETSTKIPAKVMKKHKIKKHCTNSKLQKKNN
jgi:hypothetical protein